MSSHNAKNGFLVKTIGLILASLVVTPALAAEKSDCRLWLKLRTHDALLGDRAILTIVPEKVETEGGFVVYGRLPLCPGASVRLQWRAGETPDERTNGALLAKEPYKAYGRYHGVTSDGAVTLIINKNQKQ